MNKSAHSVTSSSGRRKYSAIWQKVKNPPFRCEVTTTHADSANVIRGVTKEKFRDKNKDTSKKLSVDSVEIPSTVAGEVSTIKITFRLVEEVSINTI